jgi:hypothetical protein
MPKPSNRYPSPRMQKKNDAEKDAQVEAFEKQDVGADISSVALRCKCSKRWRGVRDSIHRIRVRSTPSSLYVSDSPG